MIIIFILKKTYLFKKKFKKEGFSIHDNCLIIFPAGFEVVF